MLLIPIHRFFFQTWEGLFYTFHLLIIQLYYKVGTLLALSTHWSHKFVTQAPSYYVMSLWHTTRGHIHLKENYNITYHSRTSLSFHLLQQKRFYFWKYSIIFNGLPQPYLKTITHFLRTLTISFFLKLLNDNLLPKRLTFYSITLNSTWQEVSYWV